jgi:hypothetical protein
MSYRSKVTTYMPKAFVPKFIQAIGEVRADAPNHPNVGKRAAEGNAAAEYTSHEEEVTNFQDALHILKRAEELEKRASGGSNPKNSNLRIHISLRIYPRKKGW